MAQNRRRGLPVEGDSIQLLQHIQPVFDSGLDKSDVVELLDSYAVVSKSAFFTDPDFRCFLVYLDFR